MNSIDEIMANWNKDSVIDQIDIGGELTKIPQLHSKYLNVLTHYKLLTKSVEFKIAEMKKLKWQYYTGKISQEELNEYGWEPFPYVLKSDVSTYIEGDKDLNRLHAQKTKYQECVTACEFIMKELHSRTFQLKSYIDWEKFKNGG